MSREFIPLLVLSLTACGPGKVGEAVAGPEPENPLVAPAPSKCPASDASSSQLVVEWPSTERASLEAHLSRDTVAVAFQDCNIEVLRRCEVGAGYRYTGVTAKVDAVKIRNTDELYANLPVGAVRLEGELERGNQLAVSMNVVGVFESERTDVG